MKPILVGGFLGAGKTTLLWETAQRLTARGGKVGLITNDQAPDLVDTAILSHSGAGVREVAGSCFCCNFNGFQQAVQSLADAGAEYVVAEPVGSCTDLSATIMQPLKERFPQYELAPLSVLIDPARVRGVLQAPRFRLHADAAYILRLQLEEADRIVLNKADTLGTAERRDLLAYLAGEFPHAGVSAISALSGDGVAEWLDALLAGAPTGERIVAVDYDRYANGEAVLGWLNAVANLRWIGGLQPTWADFVRDFFAHLQDELQQSESEIGHLKALLDCGHARITANLTALDGDLHLRETGAADRLSAMLTVNARVQTSPANVESAFRRALAAAAHGRVAATVTACHCLTPGRPEPTYRYAEVVTRA